MAVSSPTSSLSRPLFARGLALALLSIAATAAQAASYRVHPLPVGSPDHGSRVLLTNPHDAAASPFGWHDTNGAPGAEHTILRGNNVWVYVDANNDHGPDGSGPDGGVGLIFDHAANLSQPPLTYADALATNAFYVGNMLHDILWHHGFREADGNFQDNNYGNGGLGNDAMRIEIFNGANVGLINNATMARTPDGTPPRIEMYVWNGPNPDREGSFDAGVLAWAYLQVAQARLQPGCGLSNIENPVVGYSDYVGILITNDFDNTTPATPRGLGTYVLAQPVTGTGIRSHPYTTDMTVNPLTYANTVSAASQHVVGTIFASALWDLTWKLVELEGASNNLFTGEGGENRALRLAIRAIKSQPCNSGLVSARDALLAANGALYGNADECAIWEVFARRGLGASASQGSPTTVADNIAAFDLPEQCGDVIFADGFEPPPSPPSYAAFCWNGGSIQIPAGQPGATSGAASIYPVPVTVSGIASPIEHIRLRLQGLTHTYPGDIDVLMVGPQGQKFIAQSDAGGEFDVSAITYNIEDAAPALLPTTTLASGAFRPADYEAGDTFAAPAPPAPYLRPVPAGSATFSATFAGSNANGTWNVYIVDDAGQDVGSLTGLCVDISPQ